MNILFLILVVALSGRHGYEVGRASKDQKGAKKVQKGVKRCNFNKKGAERCILIERIHDGNRKWLDGLVVYAWQYVRYQK